MKRRGFVQDYAGGIDEKLTITTDATGSYSYQLRPFERIVEVVSTLGVGTIKMPPVAECKGMTFSITELLGTNDITITEYSSNESQDWNAPGALTAALDRVVLLSDGKRWTIISPDYTT
jgi:hypothetical protein